MGVRRGQVYLVQFDPVVGSEVAKPRPCVVVSPDDLNTKANTFIGAPMSTQRRPYPNRVDCVFQGKEGQVQLDQIRALSPLRIISEMGTLGQHDLMRILDRLQEMFAL